MVIIGGRAKRARHYQVCSIEIHYICEQIWEKGPYGKKNFLELLIPLYSTIFEVSNKLLSVFLAKRVGEVISV